MSNALLRVASTPASLPPEVYQRWLYWLARSGHLIGAPESIPEAPQMWPTGPDSDLPVNDYDNWLGDTRNALAAPKAPRRGVVRNAFAGRP